MKRLACIALLLIAAIPAAAQTSEQIADGLRPVGENGAATFYVNDRLVTREGGQATFYAFLYADEDNYFLSQLKVDCLNFKYQILKVRGKMRGVRGGLDKPSSQIPITRDSAMMIAHRVVCGEVM